VESLVLLSNLSRAFSALSAASQHISNTKNRAAHSIPVRQCLEIEVIHFPSRIIRWVAVVMECAYHLLRREQTNNRDRKRGEPRVLRGFHAG